MTEATMPCISIDVNGARVAIVGLAGLQVADVYIHGALDREQKTLLDAFGGNYAADGCGHLIWLAERAVQAGDVVSVRLEENGGGGDRGKTIAELYPGHEASTRTDFTIGEAMAQELRARPRLHAGFVVQAGTSAGQLVQAASDAFNTDFAFHVLWDSFHPHQARVSMRTYSLDDVLARRAGGEHLRTTLAFGETASLALLD